ncbi:MAG: arsenic resistance N-acetyltransferase ArsN2 [Desulfosarcina sp.]|jgi:amino-acid N-acetyltransferase
METIPFNNDVEALLTACDLPVADLQDNVRVHFFGTRRDGELVGVVGVERHGEIGLLRSLAVTAAFRNGGLGRALVAHAEAWATHSGLKTIYLLTLTAGGFFKRLGYRRVDRAAAPPAIAVTAQFSGLCPSTATFMAKGLSVESPAGLEKNEGDR